MLLASAPLLVSLLAPAASAAPPAKVAVCHRRGGAGAGPISVSESAVAAHLAHGDHLVAATDPANGIDDDCDGTVDEDAACPCFAPADLDALLGGQSTYAYGWAVRSDGTTDVLSLRAYSWFQGADGQWRSPTVGADVGWDGGQAWCATWSQTWLAAPTHGWDSDGVETSIDINATEEALCRGVLEDWIADEAVPLQTW